MTRKDGSIHGVERSNIPFSRTKFHSDQEATSLTTCDVVDISYTYIPKYVHSPLSKTAAKGWNTDSNYRTKTGLRSILAVPYSHMAS
jgi:hypothetical protein